MIDTEFGANMVERTPVESPYQKIPELTKKERKEIIALVKKLRDERSPGFRFHLAAAINVDAKREVKHQVLRNAK
jgi:hypothetical protein